MAFEDVMGALMQMLTATEAAAAIGAELSLRTSGAVADPSVEAALGAVSSAAGLDLGSLEPQQQAMLLGIIRLYFAQTADLLSDPGRAPGWTYTDPLVLEGMGRASMMIPGLLAAVPDLAAVGSLLDVGVGVGWLAVGAANTWPTASVVGIDVWEPALARARANVHDSGLDHRIELRNQDATTLDDVDAFDCAWVPTFFIPEKHIASALARIAQSVRPGGWIVLGLMATPPVPLVEAATTLRTIRSGGTVLDAERAIDLLRGAGCTAIREVERTTPVPIGFVIGQVS